MIRRAIRMRGSSLPIRPGSAISANFIARLIKGCRGDVGCGYCVCEITEHFQRSNEHFSREKRPLGVLTLPVASHLEALFAPDLVFSLAFALCCRRKNAAKGALSRLNAR